MRTPCSDYLETKGVIFFPRMLDKIRLKDQGLLAPGYNFVGSGGSDCFDTRFCNFFGVDGGRLIQRTLEGGSDEEIFDWCVAEFGQPSAERIEYWNSFLIKRGWRDESSEELRERKEAEGLAGRDDIQTWIDYHDVDEGRKPRFADQG